MEKKQILNISLVLSIVTVILGSFLKIMHYPYSQFLFILGVITMLVFWSVAIPEIKSSKKIDGSEKFMWIFGLIFISNIACLVYLLSARKRII